MPVVYKTKTEENRVKIINDELISTTAKLTIYNPYPWKIAPFYQMHNMSQFYYPQLNVNSDVTVTKNPPCLFTYKPRRG